MIYKEDHLTEALNEVRNALGWDFDICPVGSVFINGEGADCDILVHDENFKSQPYLIKSGFNRTNERYGEEDFLTYRKGGINVIVIPDEEEYDQFINAAMFCKKLVEKTGEKMSKRMRVEIHEHYRNQ